MSLIRLQLHPTPRQLKQFGFAWAVFFLLLAWFAIRRSCPVAAGVLCVIGVLPPIAGWVFPSVLKALFVASSLITYPIGLLISHLIVAGLYYLVVTPMGLALRLWKPGLFPKRPDPALESYWMNRDTSRASRDYFKPY